MIRQAIYDLMNKKDLTLAATKSVMLQIMEGGATPAQIAAFLTAMRMKGETVNEITACAMVMREKCQKLTPGTDVLDIVGTGGDELNFRLTSPPFPPSWSRPEASRSPSTADGAYPANAAAQTFWKRWASVSTSRQRRAKKYSRRPGLCFLFAPSYHASMKYAAPVRRELSVRTIFNILGPLANPAGANTQLLGVYDEALVEPLASVLANLGVRRAMVVHGHDGLDEASLTSDHHNLRSERRLHEQLLSDARATGLQALLPVRPGGRGRAGKRADRP